MMLLLCVILILMLLLRDSDAAVSANFMKRHWLLGGDRNGTLDRSD